MTNTDYERSMKLKEQSEAYFREKCDENDYTYMYIDQEKMTFSSRLWKNMSKRPDYLLTMAHIGSFFVDVKAYTENIFFKKEFDFANKRPPSAFHFNIEEMAKYIELQNETSLKVWFAVMPVKEDTVLNEVNFIPLDRIFKFRLMWHNNETWKVYYKVPKKPCFTDCSKIAYNTCLRCTQRYCEIITDMVRKYFASKE